MRKQLSLLAVISLPLAACTTSPYGYGGDPVSAVLGSIGALGTGYGNSGYGYSGYGYGGGFSQAAASACATALRSRRSVVVGERRRRTSP